MNKNLFSPPTRDERQHESVSKWLKAKGRATIVAATGTGKTFIAFKAIKRVRVRYPDLSVLILVPTDALKSQWEALLIEQGLKSNTKVSVMMGASKHETKCDLLIIDEAHRISAEILSNVFKVIKYKLILGLTATFERLDGRDRILAKYAPVCDTIPIQEALINGWVSNYKDYVVILEVEDINLYQNYNREFQEHFEFFGFDFPLLMSMLGKNGIANRKAYCNEICKDPSKWKEVFKAITYHSMGAMRAMQARKKFIANHPDKLRIAQEIIKHRSDSKIITFCPNVSVAESFKNGYVYTGRDTKKKNRITLEEFSQVKSGVLHTCKLAEEGISLPDLEVGIMLGVNSSKTKAVQTLGRVIRAKEGKTAEFFTLVIRDTVETEWFLKSRTSEDFIMIDEENLMHILNNEPFETYKRKLKHFNFRY